ncbi:hypothetical protein WJX73_004269 [Symbiochloris irregularis]|uniref:Uncharacterized protein n=1 Tax=Symbiochloris irregularis TaxID=706552 RepID=A0AAW1P8V5_9CHLO
MLRKIHTPPGTERPPPKRAADGAWDCLRLSKGGGHPRLPVPSYSRDVHTPSPPASRSRLPRSSNAKPSTMSTVLNGVLLCSLILAPGATTTPSSFSPPPPNAPGNTINASALTPDETILTVTLGVVLDVPAGQPVPQATLNAFQTSFSKILALPSSAITVYEIDPPTGRKLLQTNRKLGININTAGQSTVTVASAANSVATAVSGGTLATDLQSQGVTTTITGINFQAASASSISPPPASTPPPPLGTGSSESSSRLSGGDIAGIVIGTVAGVAIIGGVIAFVILHQRGKVRRARGAAV